MGSYSNKIQCSTEDAETTEKRKQQDREQKRKYQAAQTHEERNLDGHKKLKG